MINYFKMKVPSLNGYSKDNNQAAIGAIKKFLG